LAEIVVGYGTKCLSTYKSCNISEMEHNRAQGYYSGPIGTSFYRAMHFSAKRGIAIACRLSVCL